MRNLDCQVRFGILDFDRPFNSFYCPSIGFNCSGHLLATSSAPSVDHTMGRSIRKTCGFWTIKITFGRGSLFVSLECNGRNTIFASRLDLKCHALSYRKTVILNNPVPIEQAPNSHPFRILCSGFYPYIRRFWRFIRLRNYLLVTANLHSP